MFQQKKNIDCSKMDRKNHFFFLQNDHSPLALNFLPSNKQVRRHLKQIRFKFRFLGHCFHSKKSSNSNFSLDLNLFWKEFMGGFYIHIYNTQTHTHLILTLSLSSSSLSLGVFDDDLKLQQLQQTNNYCIHLLWKKLEKKWLK